MAKYGSLFLHHLRSEGQIVDGNDAGQQEYRIILNRLPAYKKSRENVRAFREALADIKCAVDLGDSSLDFESAALATLLRHSAILGCYLTGDTDFGRYSAVESFCYRRYLPAAIGAEFPALYAYRMSLARAQPWPYFTDLEFVEQWVERASHVIEEVANVAE
jgi:hypothetical protein